MLFCLLDTFEQPDTRPRGAYIPFGMGPRLCVGSGFALLISGVVVTESVFNLPGIGRLTVDAVLARDYPVIQGMILLTSLIYVAVNLLIDLAYTLLDGYEAVILVDTVPRGGEPGTLYVLEPELDAASSSPAEAALMQGHNMDPVRVLQLVSALGGRIEHMLIVGCEPETTGDEGDIPIEMSPAVRAAVEEAVGLVESVIARLPWSE